MSMLRRVGVMLGVLTTAACQEAVHDRAEIASGGAIMRLADPLPEGAVPYGSQSRPDQQAPEEASEAVVDLATLKRGEEVYHTYCVSCHGYTGRGNGIVVRHGFPAPPSFHDAALRDISRKHIFDVITDGYGEMASFAERIAPEDRWATAAYIKTLQLALSAPDSRDPQEPDE